MKVGWFVILAGLVFVVLIGSSLAASPVKPGHDQAINKISPDLLSSINSKQQTEAVRVIIKYKPGEQRTGFLGISSVSNEKKIENEVTQQKGSVIYQFDKIAGISASVPVGSIETIAGDNSVEAIYPVKIYQIDRLQAIPLMNAGTAASSYLVNGTAINISTIDTGIYNHSEFTSPNRIIREKCYCTNESGLGCCPPDTGTSFVTESNNATDDHGHGTHVAGIAAGQGGASNGHGVATNASLLAVKVCNSTGSCSTDDIIKGIEWAVSNGANVISISLGGAVSSDCYEDGIGDWIDNLTAQGTLFVIAAGNDGPTVNTIDSPGCVKSALTVGSSMDGSYGAIPTDGISSFSSRGPTLDNRTKPDIVAPGEWITSTVPSGSCELCDPSKYNTIEGTSMATPFVSGEAALIMQKYRSYYGSMPDPSLVKAIIINAVNTTGMNSGGYTQYNNVYGSGRIDVNESLRIINFTYNSSISNGQYAARLINVTGNSLSVTLYWTENRTTRNNLDLVVGNGSQNFSYSLDANETVEKVFISNTTNGTWRAYVIGTSVTGSQPFFLASSMSMINDTTPPFWYNNRTLTAGVYNPSNYSYFNISWDDYGFISDALIEGNWSGSDQNYSMTHSGGVSYSYNAIIPDGTFYWRSWANDTAGNINVTDKWIFTVLNVAPNITSASVFPGYVLLGDNVTVSANASDYSLNYTWFNVTNSSGFGTITFMQNISYAFNATYNTSNLELGLYNVKVFANDTKNNVTTVSAGWVNVTVPRDITMSFLDYTNASANASVIVFYNGTSTVRNQTSNVTNFTSLLPEGVWDIRISADFNATLFDVNTSGNTTTNITLDGVPNSNVTLPGFVPVEIVAIQTGMSFENATIIVSNQSITTGLNITAMACHTWNITNRSCSGSWENITENSSISSGMVLLNTTNFSAFAVMRNTTCGDGFVDSGESSSTCCQDTGCSSGQSCGSNGACYTPSSVVAGGGGGGGGGGFVAPKTKRLIVSAPYGISSLKNSEKTFAIDLFNNGDVNLSGISINCNSTCTSCNVSCYNGSINISVNESREFMSSAIGSVAGRYSISISAKASGIYNQTITSFNVLECDPGSTGCDGPELFSCSSDGMAINRTACEYGCKNSSCSVKGVVGIVNGTTIAGGGNGSQDYYIVYAIIAVVFVVVLVVESFLTKRNKKIA